MALPQQQDDIDALLAEVRHREEVSQQQDDMDALLAEVRHREEVPQRQDNIDTLLAEVRHREEARRMTDHRNINISSLAVPVKAAFAAMRPVSSVFSTLTNFASTLQYSYTGFEHIVVVAMEGLPDIGVLSPRDHQAATNPLRMGQSLPAYSYSGNDMAEPPGTFPTTSTPIPRPFSTFPPSLRACVEAFPEQSETIVRESHLPRLVQTLESRRPRVSQTLPLTQTLFHTQTLPPTQTLFPTQTLPLTQTLSPTQTVSPIQTLSPTPQDRSLVIIRSWTDMTPEELKALISDAIAPLQQSNKALCRQVEGLTTDRSQILSSQFLVRQTELEARKKMIDDELRSIADKTWKAPFENYDRRLVTANSARDGDTRQWKTARFDPALMPKFRAEDDLEQWISEIQIEVDSFGEELVCPLIWRHCFTSNSSVRNWYSMLGGRTQAFMTKDEGCWLYFMQKMREVWSKPLAVAQREAEDRAKLPNETFHQFFFSKLKLLTSAFPESHSTTHISRIRAKLNDAQADRYIRERHSIAAFGEECREYDEHLKMHPVGVNRRPQFTYPSHQPTQAPPVTGSTPPKRLLGWKDPPPTTKSDRVDAYRRRVDARARTVEERLNPATNKKVRSFLRNDGTVKYIERPCDFCEKLGKKDQWHFSFECSNKSSMIALILETAPSDSDEDEFFLSGVRPSAHTSSPTSHVFSSLGKD